MGSFSEHHVQFGIFVALFVLVALLGFVASRWRRPASIHTLEEWGLGGRAFGNWVTWFLMSGDVYTAYSFVAVPTLVYGVGAAGFFAVPFLVIIYPLLFVLLPRFWSVAHANGFVTPGEFVRARFGSRLLGLLVAGSGIVATMPYIALQLIGMDAVFKVLGLSGGWPMGVAFTVLALYTFRSGLRGPALISIVKDVLVIWTVLAALILVAMTTGGWTSILHSAGAKFAAVPQSGGGLLLAPTGQLSYVTVALGSALALFLYPHTLTGTLAARNRATVRRNLAAMPLYTLLLGIVALLGYVAISAGVGPLGGDPNTVVPRLFDTVFPPWCAGLALAAIGVGAMVPAAIMSIAAANLFTRDIYRVYLRPHATPAQETRVSKVASLTVKLGALLVLALLNTQFAIDLQLIGSVVILQTLPPLAIGLCAARPHRWALVSGLVAGLLSGLVMLYQIPRMGGPNGTTVLRAHFGGSTWPLSHFGLHTNSSVFVGVIALGVNLLVVVVATGVLRLFQAPDGVDTIQPHQYMADEGDATVRHLTAEILDGELVPGEPVRVPTYHDVFRG